MPCNFGLTDDCWTPDATYTAGVSSLLYLATLHSECGSIDGPMVRSDRMPIS